MPRLITKIRQQPAWIALIITIFLCLWILSGQLTAQPHKNDKSKDEETFTKVKVKTMQAELVSREIKLYGRTEPDRMTTLRSEVKGLVTEIHVKEGETVKKSQRLLTLESNDLKAQLRSAKAVLQQRNIELQGAQSLEQKGFQSQSSLAQANANVEIANAEIERIQLGLHKTIIIAPFDGVMNQRNVEVGDLLRDGDTIGMIVDLNPLVIKADVTENWIQHLSVGHDAVGRLTSGQRVEGKIRYISSVSNPGTNTFTLEVEVDNKDANLLAGLSTELTIPIEKKWAIKITPAVLALDESGNLGVKIVLQNKVKFIAIDIVKSSSQGVWLTGLGQQADVITRGHGFVRDGDQVEAVFDDENETDSENQSNAAL